VLAKLKAPVVALVALVADLLVVPAVAWDFKIAQLHIGP
jgi:hypothetical protein